MTEQLKAPAVEDAQGASERVLTEAAAFFRKEIIMDTGLGNFDQISQKRFSDFLKSSTLKDSVFKVGEIIQVKKSNFRVVNIGRHTLTLRLIPDDNYQQVPKGGPENIERITAPAAPERSQL